MRQKFGRCQKEGLERGQDIFGVHAHIARVAILLCGELNKCSIDEVVVVVVDLELKEAIVVEKVRQHLLLVGSRTQGAEEVLDALVGASCREVGEVELGVGRDHNRALALAALAEHVHKETLHSVRCCSTYVHTVASSWVELVGLACGCALENGGFAAKGQEIAEWKGLVGVEHRCWCTPLERRVG